MHSFPISPFHWVTHVKTFHYLNILFSGPIMSLSHILINACSLKVTLNHCNKLIITVSQNRRTKYCQSNIIALSDTEIIHFFERSNFNNQATRDHVISIIIIVIIIIVYIIFCFNPLAQI